MTTSMAATCTVVATTASAANWLAAGSTSATGHPSKTGTTMSPAPCADDIRKDQAARPTLPTRIPKPRGCDREQPAHAGVQTVVGAEQRQRQPRPGESPLHVGPYG